MRCRQLFVILTYLSGLQLGLAQDFWEQTNGPHGVGVFALAVDSRDYLYAGTHSGVFSSTDEGNTWIQVGLMDTVIHTLAISPEGEIFAGTYDGVYRTTDKGESWIHVFAGTTYSYVQSLAINDSAYIFASALGCSPTWCSGGVYLSRDDGDNWFETGLMGAFVVSLATGPDGLIFAGAGCGFEHAGNRVYISYDNGDS